MKLMNFIIYELYDYEFHIEKTNFKLFEHHEAFIIKQQEKPFIQ